MISGSWKRNAEENNQSKEELKKSKQQIETLQQVERTSIEIRQGGHLGLNLKFKVCFRYFYTVLKQFFTLNLIFIFKMDKST